MGSGTLIILLASRNPTRASRHSIAALALLLLSGLPAWTQEAGQFTLVDGRVIIGTYDPATKLMQAQKAGGIIVFILEPERIASQVRYVPPVAEGVKPTESRPSHETRDYYVREKRRLDDQVIEDRRALSKALGDDPSLRTNQHLRERLFELKQEYNAIELAFRLEPDGERRRQLGEQRSTMDQEYNKFLALMAQIAGERSIVRERVATAEQIYREQLALLEKGWIHDGYGPPPIY